MLGPTKKPHTKVNISSDLLKEADKPMTVSEVLYEMFGDLPRWAIVLKGLRHREGLTQTQIGNVLGIPQANISQMENGKRAIGKKLAKRFAELFHTDYRLFL